AISAGVAEDADAASDSLPCPREGLSTSASRSCNMEQLEIAEHFNRSCLAAGEPEVDLRKARRISPSRTGTGYSCRGSACGRTTRGFGRRVVSLDNRGATLAPVIKATRSPSAV